MLPPGDPLIMQLHQNDVAMQRTHSGCASHRGRSIYEQQRLLPPGFSARENAARDHTSRDYMPSRPGSAYVNGRQRAAARDELPPSAYRTLESTANGQASLLERMEMHTAQKLTEMREMHQNAPLHAPIHGRIRGSIEEHIEVDVTPPTGSAIFITPGSRLHTPLSTMPPHFATQHALPTSSHASGRSSRRPSSECQLSKDGDEPRGEYTKGGNYQCKALTDHEVASSYVFNQRAGLPASRPGSRPSSRPETRPGSAVRGRYGDAMAY